MTTRLGLSAVPTSNNVFQAKSSGGTKGAGQFTALRVYGFPGRPQSFSAKQPPPQVDKESTDTWALAWTEDPVTDVEVFTQDFWGLSVPGASVSQVLTLDSTDNWGISIAESSALDQSGLVLKVGTDNWGVAITDASDAIQAEVATTDNWAVAITDTSQVDVIQQFLTSTDNWGIAFTESSSRTTIGTVIKTASDNWGVSLAESSVRIIDVDDADLPAVNVLGPITDTAIGVNSPLGSDELCVIGGLDL